MLNQAMISQRCFQNQLLLYDARLVTVVAANGTTGQAFCYEAAWGEMTTTEGISPNHHGGLPLTKWWISPNKRMSR